MDCAEAITRLWEYLDTELGPKEAARMRAHLTECAGCAAACRCDDAFLALLQRVGRCCSTPPELVEAVRRRYGAAS